MNTNPMFVYNQPIPQLMGYPTAMHPNPQLVAQSPPMQEQPQVVQVPAPHMPGMMPLQYQFVPVPTQGSYLTPQIVTPPPQMTVYTPSNLTVQHPLMQDPQKNPYMNQNLNNPSLNQFKSFQESFPMKPHDGYFQQGMHTPNSQNYNGPMVGGFRNSRNGPMRRSSHDNYGHMPRKSKKKFGFRSKQNMIDKVYLALVEKYKKRGILASDDEVLRGEDTIRLHVKKFRALQRIEEALMAAERMDSITIARVSIPLSMKNQFQKKGFLVYVQVEHVWMVPLAQKIFRRFDEFKKCDVARHTTEPEVKTPMEPSAEADSSEETAQAEGQVKAEETVKAEVPLKADPTKQITFETVKTKIIYPALNEDKDVYSDAAKAISSIVNEVADLKHDDPLFDDLFTGPMVPQRSRGEMGQ